ncbi:MAG: pyridoxal 5'-phosphate synthase glutaminase subunit PdxT [Chloroflexi bacterium]|nr:MAG: pyridoxal 5'-phosphate synthase glutaminase subunit PdxT [Chloroflexota bacterium]
MKVGILALQGAFAEHFGALQRLDVEATQVYLPKHLDSLDALIIPGGESTAISRLMADFDLVRPIRGLATEGLPIMGTCAGLVLLATDVTDNSVPTLGVMDIKVKRNAFGRQVDSFETDLAVPVLGEEAFRAVFIRAPVIEEVGSGVEVLARLPDGVAVAARQGKLVGCAFHPELTEDLRFHRYFLEIAAAR